MTDNMDAMLSTLMKAGVDPEGEGVKPEPRRLTAPDESLDVFAQLAQKETDLILAAELGKALLEKNEELKVQNDNLADEYSQRIEVRMTIYYTLFLICLL